MVTPFLEYERKIKPDQLFVEGYTFELTDVPAITEWGDILPPVEFSREGLSRVERIANGEPALGQTEASIAVARAAIKRTVSFDRNLGCWKLPLSAEYDDKDRARYPSLSVVELGIKNILAHRLTLEVFKEVKVSSYWKKIVVDHRCMNHACCNPYHLEAVDMDSNTRRGRLARRRQSSPDFFLPGLNGKLTYEMLENRSLGGTFVG